MIFTLEYHLIFPLSIYIIFQTIPVIGNLYESDFLYILLINKGKLLLQQKLPDPSF